MIWSLLINTHENKPKKFSSSSRFNQHKILVWSNVISVKSNRGKGTYDSTYFVLPNIEKLNYL